MGRREITHRNYTHLPKSQSGRGDLKPGPPAPKGETSAHQCTVSPASALRMRRSMMCFLLSVQH